MKKLFSKNLTAIIISAVMFHVPLLAQVKTTFTKEVRPSGSEPTGLAPAERVAERNKVDVSMQKKLVV